MNTPAPALLRPVLHAGTGCCALGLGVLSDPLLWLAAGLGVLAGWVVIPLTPLEARLRRPGEPFLGGLRTYPLAVLGLVVLLPRAEAAAAWGVLAFGDAAAALVGERVPAPRLLGHGKATWAGCGAHVLVGGLAALALATGVHTLGRAGLPDDLLGPLPGPGACFAAALGAAIVDLVPLPLDDNLPGAAAAGGILRACRELM